MAQIGFRILPRRPTNPALVALFKGLPASIISDNLSRLTGTYGLSPRHRPGTTLLGPALTVRVRSGDNLMIHKALQLGQPGDVLVIDGGGCTDRALIGEIMKNIARQRGFAGVVIDGAIDTAWIAENFPDRYALKAEDGILNPDSIAEAYWQIHCQPRDAWTHELDLRPWMESW